MKKTLFTIMFAGLVALIDCASFGQASQGITNAQLKGSNNNLVSGATLNFASGSTFNFLSGADTNLLFVHGSGGLVLPLQLGSGISITGGGPYTLTVGSSTSANPSATIGLAAVNGVATSFMTSDSAPALSQAIVPTWTGLHSFDVTATATSGTDYGIKILPTLNQRNSTNFSLIFGNETIMQAGTGNQYLEQLQVGGTNEWVVDATGTVQTGAWNASAVPSTSGGTGTGTFAEGDILAASAANTWQVQAPGSTGTVWTSNGAGALPTYQSLVAVLGTMFGNTQGNILENGAGGWGTLGPSSTAGYVLTSNGTGDDPSYQPAPGAGSVAISGTPSANQITYWTSGTAIGGVTEVPVAAGGTGLASGTSGGILGYTASGTLASSALLVADAVVIGGGGGATPTSLANAGSTHQVLHANTSASPTWSAVSLTTDASGTLQAAQMPTLAGDVTSAGATLTTAVSKISGVTVSGTTGTGNVMFSASPTSTGTFGFATFAGSQSSSAESSLASTSNGAKTGLSWNANDSGGTARKVEMGLGLIGDDEFSITNGSTEFGRFVPSTGIWYLGPSAGYLASGTLTVSFNASNGVNGIGVLSTDNGNGQAFMLYENSSGGSCGSVTRVTTTNAVTYNTTSDGRLKTNIRDFTDSGRIIDGLRPRIFDWKSGEKDAIGFVAQEENAVDPELAKIGAVTVGDDDPTSVHKEWQRSDQALVPILTAEIKSLRVRVAQLEHQHADWWTRGAAWLALALAVRLTFLNKKSHSI